MISRLVMAAAVALAASAAFLPALAQSVTSAPPPSENLTRLQERVDELEGLLRQATADSERLSIELRRAKTENTMLKRQLDDALAQQGAAASGGAEPVSPPPAPAARVSPPRAAVTPPPSAAGQLGTLPAGAAPGDAAQAFRDIRRLLNAGRYTEAEGSLVEFIAAYPTSADIPEARYFLGRTQLVNRRYTEAGDTFVEFLRKTPTSPRAPDAWVGLGMALKGMGKTPQACATFRDLTAKYPAASAATRDLAARQARDAQCPAR